MEIGYLGTVGHMIDDAGFIEVQEVSYGMVGGFDRVRKVLLLDNRVVPQ